jgi:hypothetical protein
MLRDSQPQVERLGLRIGLVCVKEQRVAEQTPGEFWYEFMGEFSQQ